MVRFLKKTVYMLILAVLAALGSFLLSLFRVDRFISYAFFFFISAYLCTKKQLPIVFIFLLIEYLVFKTNYVYNLQLFIFTITLCIIKPKLPLYHSAFLSYAVSVIICIIPAIFSGSAMLVFDKLFSYILSFVFAPPFIFAFMRAGIIPKSRKGVFKNAKKNI